MFRQYIKCDVSIFLLFSWLVTAYSGGVIFCIESRGVAEFEAGGISESRKPVAYEHEGRTILTGDKCRHYSVQICAMYRARNVEAAFAEIHSNSPQLNSCMADHSKAVCQDPILYTGDTLRTIVLTI
jgi:hypothetical protein